MVSSPKSNTCLIVAPSWVGDMVMAQSLFKALIEQNPELKIDVLAPAWCSALTDYMPEVNRLIEAPFVHGSLNFFKRWQLAKQLHGRYDMAFILPNSLKSALVPWLARIPQRVGFHGEQRYSPEQNQVLVLCPGAEFGAAKQWPVEHYAAVARFYLDMGWQVWLFGSKKDKPTCAAINNLSHQKCQNLAGKTSLSDAVALMAEADLVVSNDSGLMHVAAALQKPLVAIYGSTDPSFTPPLNHNSQIERLALDCSPCFKRDCPLGHLDCLVKLPPRQILAATENLLSD